MNSDAILSNVFFTAMVLVAMIATFVTVFTMNANTESVELTTPASNKNPVENTGKAWVRGPRLTRYTCPSQACGTVGDYYFRSKVEVIEVKDGWGRISKYYDAGCVNGISEYVDSGSNVCEQTNGIVDRKFSEWVSLAELSNIQPDNPADGAVGVSALIKLSDDFGIYESEFVAATKTVLDRNTCTESEIRENGGWVKSMKFKPKPVYFTYCSSKNVYLNVSSGKIFR